VAGRDSLGAIRRVQDVDHQGVAVRVACERAKSSRWVKGQAQGAGSRETRRLSSYGSTGFNLYLYNPTEVDPLRCTRTAVPSLDR
jgi:hypothetical protein